MKVIPTDLVDASGAMMYDLRARRWFEEILSAIGLSEELLLEARDYCYLNDSIKSEISEKTCVSKRTRVLVRAGEDVDALGVEAVKPGQATKHIGVVGETDVVANKFIFDSNCRVESYLYLIDGLWCVRELTQTFESTLKWFKKSFRIKGRRACERIFDSTLPKSAFSDGLVFPLFSMDEKLLLRTSRARVFSTKPLLNAASNVLSMILDIIEFLGVR